MADTGCGDGFPDITAHQTGSGPTIQRQGDIGRGPVEDLNPGPDRHLRLDAGLKVLDLVRDHGALDLEDKPDGVIVVIETGLRIVEPIGQDIGQRLAAEIRFNGLTEACVAKEVREEILKAHQRSLQWASTITAWM